MDRWKYEKIWWVPIVISMLALIITCVKVVLLISR